MAAIRCTSLTATSALVIRGHASAPSADTTVTVLSPPPMMPVSGRTSLATIRSQRFFASFFRALATTSSVSAAKPTTTRGRAGPGAETVARMSGFSTSVSAGGRPESSFLIFDL